MSRLALFLSVLVISILATGQSRDYSRVYMEIKNGSTWSGTQKTTYSVNVSNVDKGGIYLVALKKSASETYYFSIKFEAMTADNRAFHSVLKGVWGEPVWTSPSGSKEITWVYFNKSIETIMSADPKPFDFEVQFADGSGVKYYVSP